MALSGRAFERAGTVVVDQLLADLPAVHAMDDSADPAVGIWSTDRDCYCFIADHVAPGARTLETGSGLSTILLAMLGARHTCVTPATSEAERITAYCRARAIAVDAVRFELGCSDEVLPRLVDDGPLDLVLIDGNHGFPTPMIDWYYAATRLRRDGILVLDDTALPAVTSLCTFLDGDPRFVLVHRTSKWCAYRRVDDGPLRQDWFQQPAYSGAPPLRASEMAGRALRKARREAARVIHRFRPHA